MNGLDSLLVLLQQAESARDKAQAEHRRAEGEAAAAQVQMTQLTDYRGANEKRYSEQFKQGSSIELMRHYQSFMQRLSQAITQQDNIVQHQKRRVDSALGRLQERELQVASIRKLIERRMREKQQRDERRDQRQTDEAASRAANFKPSMFSAALGSNC